MLYGKKGAAGTKESVTCFEDNKKNMWQSPRQQQSRRVKNRSNPCAPDMKDEYFFIIFSIFSQKNILSQAFFSGSTQHYFRLIAMQPCRSSNFPVQSHPHIKSPISRAHCVRFKHDRHFHMFFVLLSCWMLSIAKCTS